MFQFDMEYKHLNIGKHLLMYYVIAKPKPELKEGTVTLYLFGNIGTDRPGLLELIHIELLSIAQVIASEEGDLQLRLRATSAPTRMYHKVVIPDYIVRTGEKVIDLKEAVVSSLVLSNTSAPEDTKEGPQEEVSATIVGIARKLSRTRGRSSPASACPEV
ncbi:hypothetical protein CBR_g9215 [Chara braunii]|uniref:Uncharacterized protein n=1 Tax=Chara braunii TaxID=69332 RepID=A0A388KP27_CHABU|nr:hypothetical protein CBR_g9215 [Chara braunii]|eukprot:GBG71806.1 hypothetical protein CBR_g9215 [Chara braunii]